MSLLQDSSQANQDFAQESKLGSPALLHERREHC